MRPFRYESNGSVQASPGQVFAHIDDPTRLASHMCKGAWRMAHGAWRMAHGAWRMAHGRWRMAGDRMSTATAAGRGQAVGSQIRVSGRVLGVERSLEELVL